MNQPLLPQLAQHSAIIAETADPSVVARFGAGHANLSAGRITAAAQDPKHAEVVSQALEWARRKIGKAGNRKLVAMTAVQHLAIGFAQNMLAAIDGKVSIELDGRLAFKRRASIDSARELIAQLAAVGCAPDRILIKLPATWEGIEAARLLERKDGIRCHLTMVFGMHQLAASADAGAALISPSVGRISDHHRKAAGVEAYAAECDPGVLLTRRMAAYLKQHAPESALAPSTFRNIDQVVALAGCSHLCLPPKLLELLRDTQGSVCSSQGSPEGSEEETRLEIDAARFKTLHEADAVSRSKLQAAIQNLSWAMVSQEKQLVEWISQHQDRAAQSSTAALFAIWDYDGDGFIDREEWSGSDAVFNALDADNNGRISLEEMALGLGAPMPQTDDA